MLKHVSVSRELVYLSCPRKYWYQYVAKARPIYTACNLAFGTAVHAALERILLAEVDGTTIHPVTTFDEEFEAAFAGQSIKYSSTFREPDLRATGRRLVDQFLGAWHTEGLVPFVDAEGPFLERSLTANLGGGLTITGAIDCVAMKQDGSLVVIDFKTPAQESFEDFELVSDQLTMYQVLLEHPSNASKIGLECVDGLGFMELLKKKVPKTRGEGPVIKPIRWAPRRSEEDVAEFVQKLHWTAKDIRSGRFPRTSMAAFNSPCTLCDYAKHCIRREEGDLVFENKNENLQLGAA